jgi:hypothetical protein
MIYNKSEAIEVSKKFLKEVRLLEEKYGVSFNSDSGDIYLTYKSDEDGKVWDNIKIGWEGDGTGLKVMEPEIIQMYEFKLYNKNGVVTKSQIPCDDDLQAMRISMELANSKNIVEVKYNLVNPIVEK